LVRRLRHLDEFLDLGDESLDGVDWRLLDDAVELRLRRGPFLFPRANLRLGVRNVLGVEQGKVFLGLGNVSIESGDRPAQVLGKSLCLLALATVLEFSEQPVLVLRRQEHFAECPEYLVDDNTLPHRPRAAGPHVHAGAAAVRRTW
jgi:hypothetical protein